MAEVRATARLAGPLILAQMAVMTMAIVDTAVVGRHSKLELAAVSLGNSLTFGLLVFGTGFTLALEPLISQALGREQPQRAWAWWRLGLKTAVAISVPLSLLVLAVSLMTPLFGVEEPVARRCTDYLVARTPAMVFYLVYMAARSFLQSHQRTRPLWVAAIVANVFNFLADIALVNGDAGLQSIGLPAIGAPAWGGVGAGIATSVSTGVMALILLVDIRRHYRPAEGTPVARVPARRLVALGIPLGLQSAAEFMVFSTVGVLAATIDQASAGAHQIGLHVSTLTFMGAVGISSAASARVGLAIGRGGGPAVRRAGLAAATFGMVFMAVSALCFLLFNDEIAALFAPDEPEVLAIASRLILIASVFQLFDGLQVVMSGALRGAGDVRLPFIINVVTHWGVGFPVAVGLAFGANMGAEGLWVGLTVGLTAVSLALSARFMRLTADRVSGVE